MKASREDLLALHEKYEQMLALRRAHDRARTLGIEEPDPRPTMALLAERFPGSLRELDRLPLDVIEDRLGALDAAIAEPDATAEWMTVQALVHRHARGALVVKRWLAGRRQVDAELHRAFLDALPTLPRAEDAAQFSAQADFAAIAAPPRGRTMDVVHAAVAVRLGISAASVRALAWRELDES